MNLTRGSVMFFAVDTATGKKVGDVVYIAHVPDSSVREVRNRFLTGASESIQLLFADGNLQPAISQFQVLNPAQIAVCP